MGLTWSNPTHVGWVGLNFFLTHHDGLGQKIPSTQPMHPYLWSPSLLYYSYFLLLPFTSQFSLFLSAQDPKPTWKSDTNLKCDRTLSLLLLY